MQAKKRQFFGTDGVRDVANSGMMRPEAAMRLGAAYTVFLRKRGAGTPKIAVGRDTRRSGEMLQSALMAGIASAGGSASDLGVIPTPGVSSVGAHNDFDGGAVISASHNPPEYNGIKFLDKDGFKLTDDDEADIEEIFLDEKKRAFAAPVNIGGVSDGSRFREEYAKRLKKIIEEIKDYSCPIVIDAANGAASAFVEPLFSDWRGRVTFIANKPNGVNINENVGVTHIDTLALEVVKNKAELGIAYDGDTDRVLTLDGENRRILHLAAVFACNFTNHMYDLASRLLADHGIPFSVLLPLIDETAAKVHDMAPRDAQTGPAVRYDENVMRRQLAMLSDAQTAEIYKLLSQSIHDKLRPEEN